MINVKGTHLEMDEWNDSRRGIFLWSSVNVSEAVPDVMTPVTWSLWQIYYRDASPIRFPGDYPFCGNICGRPYLNLSLVVSLYQAVGKDIRKELHGDLIASAPGDLEIPEIPFSPLKVIWTVLPGILMAQSYARRQGRNLLRFIEDTPTWCREILVQIKGSEQKADLLRIWQESLRPYFVEACRLLRSVTMEFSDSSTRLRLELTKLVGEAEAYILMSNLSGKGANLESLGPLMGLANVAQGRLEKDAYLERYGHRGPHEMELSASGPEGDPNWLDKRLDELKQAPLVVEELLAKQRSETSKSWKKLVTDHPKEAGRMSERAEKTAEAGRRREAVRGEVTRLARLVRQFTLQAGKLSELNQDIFFLRLDEIAHLLAGDTSAIVSIPVRRERYISYCALPPYPSLIIGEFDAIRWASNPERRGDFFDERAGTLLAPEGSINGFAGAAGRVEGVVRRLDRPEEGDQLHNGEILVTVTTNVGWTPLFPRLGAIITDVGAPLSHAAIVARELGIPAVVGCGNATQMLKTGDRVVVDGSTGKITILQRK